MIEDELKKAWAIDKSIDILEEEIQRLSARAMNPSSGDNKMENNTVGYLALLAKLEQDKDKLYQQLIYLDECVNLVKNPLHREILRARYICGLSRKEVAEKFNYTEVWVAKITQSAIAEINTRLNCIQKYTQ